MFKRLLLIVALGVTLSGCFMVPMAFIGPATSGFTTASIIQSGITTGAGYMVKKSTGKSITEHAMDAIGGDTLKQTYMPNISECLTIDYVKSYSRIIRIVNHSGPRGALCLSRNNSQSE